ncbi:hypothetical protein PENSPDRAFT_455015 [Peniophora sp. CONT]|nr:hypothetical protein PENSPDRAFT_455015 [Peniophora sp. CONT]
METDPISSSLSANAAVKVGLPPWTHDILDAPSSDSESEGTEDHDGSESLSDDANDTLYGDAGDKLGGKDVHAAPDSGDEAGNLSDADSVASSDIDYYMLVEERPLEALALLRTLYDERVPGGRNPELRELIGAIKQETYSAVDLVDDLRTQGTGLSEPGVLNELFYIRLSKLCSHILDSPGLFDEHPKWIREVFRICRIFCELAWREYQLCAPQTPISSATIRQRLAFIPRLLAEAWSHRDVFVKSSWMEEHIPGSSAGLRDDMHSLLIAIGILEHEGVRLGIDGVFRSLCMQFWFLSEPETADLSDEDMLACSVWSFTPHDGYSAESVGALLIENISRWVEDDICATYGAQAFLDRLVVTLRNPQVVHHRLDVISPIIGIGLRAPVFRPLFPRTRILPAIRAAVDRHTSRSKGSDLMILLNQVCLFIEYYADIEKNSEELVERAELLVRQLDAFEIIALTVVNSVLDPLDVEIACTDCLHTFCHMIIAVNDTPNASKELKKQIKKSVKRHWYKTIVDVREIVRSGNLPIGDAQVEKRGEIVASWAAFAKEYGLDPDHEEAQYLFELKRTAQFCASKDCEFHKKMPPHPTRACAGCSEVRYCSRACQLKDWKDGGHKARCKRLKQTEHSPRQR